jgi:hypothetical protein
MTTNPKLSKGKNNVVNIKKSNIMPFIDVGLYENRNKFLRNNGTIRIEDYQIKDIFLNNDPLKNIPTIPSIYFLNDDMCGYNIIDAYYNIKYYLKKLYELKTFILTILEESKDEIEKSKKNLDKQKYNLTEKDTILNKKTELQFNIFKRNITNQSEFNIFKKDFVKNNYSIFKENTFSQPYFVNIFQIEYKGSNKNFFLNLFREYSKIRNKILKYRNNLIRTTKFHRNDKENEYYSLLAFSNFFDLDPILKMKEIKEKEKNKNVNNKSNTINYNDYILNVNNDNLNNNEKKRNEDNIFKPILYKKIHKYNLLYLNDIDKNIYKKKHSENIDKIYDNLYKYYKEVVDENKVDIYENIISLIELDYSLIEFLYYYVEKRLYNNAIDINYQVKNNINEKINVLEDYYDEYLEWYKKFRKYDKTLNPIDLFLLDEVDFEKFFMSLMDEMYGIKYKKSTKRE